MISFDCTIVDVALLAHHCAYMKMASVAEQKILTNGCCIDYFTRIAIGYKTPHSLVISER